MKKTLKTLSIALTFTVLLSFATSVSFAETVRNTDRDTFEFEQSLEVEDNFTEIDVLPEEIELEKLPKNG